MHVYWLYVDVNECIDLTLCNNGTCINEDGGYSCVCESGYTGASCENGMNI